MTARLVFLDTETTGLDLDADIWEFAAIVREPHGSETEHHMFIEHDRAKCARLPEPFYEDHCRRFTDHTAIRPIVAAARIAEITADKAHIVGAVPNFDTERIERLLRTWGWKAEWHHHLIDVEPLMVGFLAARGERVELPWRSDDLAERCGVPPVAPGERHTALGDVRWVRAIYDRITTPASVGQWLDERRAATGGSE